jgi:hypothetical protein
MRRLCLFADAIPSDRNFYCCTHLPGYIRAQRSDWEIGTFTEADAIVARLGGFAGVAQRLTWRVPGAVPLPSLLSLLPVPHRVGVPESTARNHMHPVVPVSCSPLAGDTL